MSTEVANQTVYKKLNAKVNNLENKIHDRTTLIHAEKRFGEKKLEMSIKKTDISGLVTTLDTWC